MSELVPSPACPLCQERLESKGAEFRCPAKGCGGVFPVLGDVPCLVPDPVAWLGHWLLEQMILEKTTELQVDALQKAMQATQRESTRNRLLRLLQAEQKRLAVIEKILSPLSKGKKKPVLEARVGMPQNLTLLYHYTNVLRDWAWGDEENRIALEAVRGVSPEKGSLGDCLVLGAGACRLAADLHHSGPPSRTIALDWNPFLLFSAKRALEGAPLELPEFPLPPRSLENVVALHECKAPYKLDERFRLVIGDATAPPFPEASFDTVLTPWLIDVISEDALVFLARVNRLLRPGGRWIHFGPLGFLHPAAGMNYTAEELSEVAREVGLEPESSRWLSTPYLRSELSCQSREEQVLCLSAIKRREV